MVVVFQRDEHVSSERQRESRKGETMFAREDREPSPIRVLVVDSSQMHSQLLADGIGRDQWLRSFSASTPADFLQVAAREQIDVVVISSTLDEQPGRGFEVLRTFHSSHPDIPAVMLLESSRREMVVEAFRAGTRGVLGKQVSLADLCKCIHCVYQGQVWASSKEMLFALDVLASCPSISAVDHRGMSLLSEREIEVVLSLAEGLTNKEIGERLGLSRHTVKNYLFRIFDKIGVSSRVELLHLTLRQPVAMSECVRQRNKDKDKEQENISEFELCYKAAEDGSPMARVNLTELYRNGQGTPKDHVAAYMWYLLSERAMEDLRQRANLEKAKLLRVIKPNEILEAQQRASEWLRDPDEPCSAFPSRGVALEKEPVKLSIA